MNKSSTSVFLTLLVNSTIKSKGLLSIAKECNNSLNSKSSLTKYIVCIPNMITTNFAKTAGRFRSCRRVAMHCSPLCSANNMLKRPTNIFREIIEHEEKEEQAEEEKKKEKRKKRKEKNVLGGI